MLLLVPKLISQQIYCPVIDIAFLVVYRAYLLCFALSTCFACVQPATRRADCHTQDMQFVHFDATSLHVLLLALSQCWDIQPSALFGDGEQQLSAGRRWLLFHWAALRMQQLFSACGFGLIPLIYIYWNAIKLLQLRQPLQDLQNHPMLP